MSPPSRIRGSPRWEPSRLAGWPRPLVLLGDFNATPGSAQRDIKGAMRVMRSIHALQDLHAETGGDPERFAKAFRES